MALTATMLALLLSADGQSRPPSKDGDERKLSALAAPDVSDAPYRQVAQVLPLKRSTFVGSESSGPFLRCGVEADGGCGDGYAWACRTRDGAAVTVTNKCGNGAEPGPFYDAAGSQSYVMKDITVTTYPYIAAATAAAAGIDQLWRGPYTAVGVFRATALTSGFPYFIAHGNPSSSGVQMYVESTKGNCYHSTSGSAIGATSSVAALDVWLVFTCTYDGSTNNYGRINGNTSAAGAPGDPTAPTASNLHFGFNGTHAQRGGFAQVLIYDRQLTSAELSAIEADVAGLSGRTVDATVDANGTRFVLGDDGKWQAVGQDLLAVTPTGADIWESVTNYWTQSLDASAWVDVGTPTVTTNVASGPWSTYNVGAEADDMSDNDAVALEGKESASAGTTTGSYTVSCYLASNTATDYTLSVVTDGTGGGSCTGTGLTSSYALKTCTPTAVSGVPTYVKGRVLVGDAVGDTGAIRVSGCQLTRTAYQQRACVAAGTAATCVADAVSATSTGWPASHGRVTLRYTPGVANGFATNRALVWARDGGGAYGWGITINATDGKINGFAAAVAGFEDFAITGALTWTEGQTYAIDVRWTSAGVWTAYRDGVLVGTYTTTRIPVQVLSPAVLGSTGSSLLANGRISDVTVWR